MDIDAITAQHKLWVANDLEKMRLAKVRAGDELREARAQVEKLHAIYTAAVDRWASAEWAAKQEVA